MASRTTEADPLAALADLPGVRASCDSARSAIDAVLWDRGVRSRAAEVVAESVRRGAHASAALDGVDVPVERLRAVRDDSPMARVLDAALRVTQEVPGQLEAWSRSPLQVLARLHAVGAREFVSDGEVGRPRDGDAVDDPLHLGVLPPAAEVTARLATLAQVVTAPTAAPALLVAAIVHGELLLLRPFTWGSGLVARVSVRLVLAQRGVDPDLLGVPEAGVLAGGRGPYVKALRAFASGTPEGVADWIMWHCGAVRSGARAAVVTG